MEGLAGFSRIELDFKGDEPVTEYRKGGLLRTGIAPYLNSDMLFEQVVNRQSVAFCIGRREALADNFTRRIFKCYSIQCLWLWEKYKLPESSLWRRNVRQSFALFVFQPAFDKGFIVISRT